MEEQHQADANHLWQGMADNPFEKYFLVWARDPALR